MTKKQKMVFGVIITLVIIVGLIVSVSIISSDKTPEENTVDVIDPVEETEVNMDSEDGLIESEESEEVIIEEQPIVEDEPEEVVIEDYIEQEDVDKQALSEEELALRDEYAAAYVAEKSSQDIQPPFDSMLERVRQDYDSISWEQVYLTKGNFIWWIENEAPKKVDVPFTVSILDEKGLINIYVEGNQEATDTVKENLDKWIASTSKASAYNETGTEFQVNYHAEQ